MTLLDFVAAIVLSIELPLPIFWLLVHLAVRFWRRHRRAAYFVAGLTAWCPVVGMLVVWRDRLFRAETAAGWQAVVGLVLIWANLFVLFRVLHELGAWRLTGRAELSGTGELRTHGLYAHVRHPLYTANVCGVAGACFLAASMPIWVAAIAWVLLGLPAVLAEERELRARFGPAYEEYCNRVPRFLPLRIRPGGGPSP